MSEGALKGGFFPDIFWRAAVYGYPTSTPTPSESRGKNKRNTFTFLEAAISCSDRGRECHGSLPLLS